MNRFNQICIIDDDLIFVLLFKKIVSKIGYQNKIIHFVNGHEAFEGLKKINNEKEDLPDLIFLDINMPIVDGWQFLDLVKEHTFKSKLTIYMVSSTISSAEIQKAKSNEFIEGFLPKPIENQDLIGIMN